MASIRQRNGKWNVQVRVKGNKTISKTYTRRKDAELWAKKTELELEIRAWNDTAEAESTLFKDAVSKYLREISAGLAMYSVDKYISKILIRELGLYNLLNLSPTVLSEFRDKHLKQGKHPQTVKHYLGMISRVLNACLKKWYIHIPTGNPIALVEKPAISNGRDRVLVWEEMEQLLDTNVVSKSAYMRFVILIAYETAMRRSEILRIKREDLDVEARTLHIPITKTKTPRTIPLTKNAVKHILEWVVMNRKVSPAMVSMSFRDAVKEAKIPYARFHDLRHTAISRFAEMGLNVIELSSISGHKDMQMLKRYTHINPLVLVEKLDSVK